MKSNYIYQARTLLCQDYNVHANCNEHSEIFSTSIFKKRIYLSLSFSLLLFSVANCSDGADAEEEEPAALVSCAAPAASNASHSAAAAAATKAKHSADTKTKKDKKPHRGARGGLWNAMTESTADNQLINELLALNDGDAFDSGDHTADAAFITDAAGRYMNADNYSAVEMAAPRLLKHGAPVTDVARRAFRQTLRKKQKQLILDGATTAKNRLLAIHTDTTAATEKCNAEQAKVQKEYADMLDRLKTEHAQKLAKFQQQENENRREAEQAMNKAKEHLDANYTRPLQKVTKLLHTTYLFDGSNSDYEEDETETMDITKIDFAQLPKVTVEQIIKKIHIKRALKRQQAAQDQVEGS